MTEPCETYDVVIVGYGPVGATLGHLLGRCGVKTLILERDIEPYPLPRAVHFDDEVMRVFQSIGLAEQVAAISRVNIGMRFVDPGGKLLLDWPRPQQVGRQGWHASYRFHQPDLEAILRRTMPLRTSVTTRLGCEAIKVIDHGNHCTIQANDNRLVKAGYVIGCDGARSILRQTMATEMRDYGFHERWLVVDLLLNQPKPDLGDWSIQHCDPDRPATYVRGPENRRRWEISLKPGETTERMTNPAEIWRLLAKWIIPSEATLERAAVYTFHALIAQNWRCGRLLLAGDAAHQTPPFMGQGMCAGIRDAANLAWKLALVVQNKADTGLLDSYQSERLPNAAAYITTAVRLGGLINTAGTRAALEAAFPTPDGSARMESIAPTLGAGIGKGIHAGRLFGQPRLQNGDLMDTACGYRSVLVVDEKLAKAASFPQDLQVLTQKDAPDIAKELALAGVKAALIRPDGYIQGTANNAQSLASLIVTALPSPT